MIFEKEELGNAAFWTSYTVYLISWLFKPWTATLLKNSLSSKAHSILGETTLKELFVLFSWKTLSWTFTWLTVKNWFMTNLSAVLAYYHCGSTTYNDPLFLFTVKSQVVDQSIIQFWTFFYKGVQLTETVYCSRLYGISTRYICGFMCSLHKKSWTVSNNNISKQ